jgi:uridine kinase
MLEDVLIIKQKHRLAAKAIVRLFAKELQSRQIIAISGESGSGKSEMANTVAKQLKTAGYKVKVIHSDDFYVSIPEERNDIRIKNGISSYVGLGEYDWARISKVLEAFQKGRSISMPCVDLITNEVDTLTTDFKNVDILILDGLYAIAAKEANYRVFIDLTYHETKKAQLHRGKETMDSVRFQVLEAEHLAVSSLRDSSDVFITKAYKVIRAK